ncbi:hypothetical protein [Mongoliitalea daihaiensis]|uniref:hypothetical protein n=1 Tax=Mongoliitalea daihaiensis TaxID=2782006 RepID=UPI001F3EA95C|nr:hypothetical protein [Mongoliitalea daihaiensis]UJP65915.1 hypothetical protein IPZ59_04640 [Mongoliitalea daihaiensis]
MKTKQSLLIILCMLGSLQLLAQAAINQHINMKVDERGNAAMLIQQKMTASQWQQWLATAGTNPNALKREIQKGMPGFFLDDFKLDRNDMERSFELSLTAYGVTKVDKRGRRILETGEKDINLTKIGDKQYMFVNSPMEYGGQLQQTTVVDFPISASNIQIDKDAFGRTIFTYQIDDPSKSLDWRYLFGGLMMLAGVVSMVYWKPQT